MQRCLIFLGTFIFAHLAYATNGDIESLLQQGYAQTQAGELEQAEQTLQLAITKAPDSSLAYTRLGGVKLLRQQYSAGIKDFQQAIMLDENNATAFIGMAVAYLHMGQQNLAKAALHEAMRLDPSKKPEIDKVLAWIEQRSNTPTFTH
ncbi:MAG: tetratricopeptide repeat protein [Chromatiales bacterium]|jgi:Flp pilus assembly protein TadD